VQINIFSYQTLGIIFFFIFQLKLKMQSDKINPSAFSLDWDSLSETEMKRLVGQLEKTK